MHQLPDPAIEAILKEWHLNEYEPPNTNIQEWNRSIETLCDTYGIPDTQRPQCAMRFVKSDLRAELERVLEDARERFGPIHWAPFAEFMVALDRAFRESWENLPFYRRYPGLAGAALCATGAALLAPVGVIAFLGAAGFTATGVVAGSLAATIQSVVYGGATGGIFALLQSAGATMVLPSVGTIITGAAASGAGLAVMGHGESVIAGETLSDSLARFHQPGNVDPDDENDGDPPPYHRGPPREYLLTSPAIQAIVKCWSIAQYNPPGMKAVGWMNRVRRLCEVYGVPVTQRPLCAMYHMRGDCRAAAHAAGCYEMTWDQFEAWLLKYDDEDRTSTNRKLAELLVKKEKD